MKDHDWLNRLYQLVSRQSGSGVEADLNNMTLSELWGLYCRYQGSADER